MLKANQLRAIITAHIPTLAQHPDRLNIFITNGKIIGLGQTSLNYDYEYECVAVLTNFTGNLDELAIPVYTFMREQMPELMCNHDEAPNAINFEAEIINNNTVDLAVTVKLRETVRVTAHPNGTHTAEHLPALTRDDDQAREWVQFQHRSAQ